MKENNLNLLICSECKAKLNLKIFSKQNKDIKEGLLVCTRCNSWFPISDSIPNMLPRYLANASEREEFARKWKIKKQDNREKEDLQNKEKLNQASFFDEEVENYDDNIWETSFWKAYGKKCMQNWLPQVKENQLMLDIGCGTGRASLPFAEKGIRVIGCDISKGMLMEAKKQTRFFDIDYIIADVENLPFKENSFDACIAFGILHHLENPLKLFESANRVLKSEGLYFGHENNKSKFRFLFDWSMKLFKLWEEEAGNFPLISEEEIKEWGTKTGFEINPKTSVFLPPHIFNLFETKTAKKLLSLSDKICTSLPLLKHEGGALILEGKKLA